MFDEGTSRTIVKTKEKKQALLVTYSSGGVTPGDSYLWLLNEDGLPQSFKMWVSILPIGGLEVSWEGWKKMASGARMATKHEFLFIDFAIESLRMGQSLIELGIKDDPFIGLKNSNK